MLLCTRRKYLHSIVLDARTKKTEEFYISDMHFALHHRRYSKLRYLFDADETTSSVDPITYSPLTFEKLEFDEEMEALGEDGFKAVVGALAMFRSM